MRTRARRRGGDWVIDGAKLWITNGALADVAIVWAATDDGINAFLVEKGRAGSCPHVIKNKLSLRASSTAELEFADVRVPDSARLPDAEWAQGRAALPRRSALRNRVGRLRRSRGCIETVLSYTQSRELFGRPLNRDAVDPNAARERRAPAHGAQLLALAAREAERSRCCDDSADIAREVEQRACGAR